MVRLKDIAERAGVSVMTASKALRDQHDISSATKSRVREIALQLGYVPNSSAQGLRNRKTKLLGIAISALTSPVYSRTVLALEGRARELGYDVLLAHTLDQPESEEACIRRFLSRRVDGLFIAPAYRLGSEARIYKELLALKTPTILLGHAAPFCQNFVSISGDDLSGAHLATQHLLKLGHRRIAFLGGPPANPWAQERFDGYRRALREANLDVDDKLVFQAGRTIEDGSKAALQMINESCDATAIQCVNDPIAIGCSQELVRQGLSVPGDVSIVGFGNILLSEYFRVPLTTVRQPKFRLGMAAFEAMQQFLRGKRPDSKRLSTELVVRESSGTPPATCRLKPKTATETTI